jgi:hypothetical protein
MKVELDDCLSLSSDEITFDARYTSHASMPSTPIEGDEWIRIYSNASSPFPYAATSDYEPDGLVAHFDGINNTGAGDKFHDNSATSWKDLSQNNNDLTNNNYEGYFTTTGYIFDGKENFWKNNNPVNLPVGNHSFTTEMRYAFAGSFATSVVCTVSWGTRGTAGTCANCTGFRGLNQLTHAFGYNDIDIAFPNAQTVDNTLSITYTAGTGSTYQQTARKAYGNAQPLSYASYQGSHQWQDPNTTIGKPLIIGGHPLFPDETEETFSNPSDNTNLHLQSVRIYNRALTEEEISANFALDEMRYISPPQVWIGTQQCANVTVLSPRVLTCKVPVCTQTPNTPLDIEVRSADTLNQILIYYGIFTYEQ